MSRHLLIAGTGRAGTSFLVRYLAQIGMETSLSRADLVPVWDDQANAGFETVPLPSARELPYIIKSPWAYQFIDDLLTNPSVELDAVVIPMRDLTEAASSRCIVELQAAHNKMPWMGELSQTWENLGYTPGGVVFSTNPVDQARLLAVGFHHLLDQLVKADIPVVLLSFPRFVEDADYLHHKLDAVLPKRISLDRSRIAHAETADPRKVRVGAELDATCDRTQQGFSLVGPSPDRLERAALLRMVADVRKELAAVQVQLATMEAAERSVRCERDCQASDLQQARSALSIAADERDAALLAADRHRCAADAANLALVQERDCHVAEIEVIQQAMCAGIEARDQAQEALRVAQSDLAGLDKRLAAIENATTWRAALALQKAASLVPWAIPLVRRFNRRTKSKMGG